MFPLGEMIKPEVRQLAHQHSLPSASARESQEVSFIVGDYRKFLQAEIPEKIKEGQIITAGGQVIGQHAGLPLYTIGQRKGLNTALNIPLYVKEFKQQTNQLVVSKEEEAKRGQCYLKDITWVSGHEYTGSTIEVRLRHHAKKVMATMKKNKVAFKEPQLAVAIGQSIVFYEGDKCLGGGVIEGY